MFVHGKVPSTHCLFQQSRNLRALHACRQGDELVGQRWWSKSFCAGVHHISVLLYRADHVFRVVRRG
jgi:hypothetical protein